MICPNKLLQDILCSLVSYAVLLRWWRDCVATPAVFLLWHQCCLNLLAENPCRTVQEMSDSTSQLLLQELLL